MKKGDLVRVTTGRGRSSRIGILLEVNFVHDNKINGVELVLDFLKFSLKKYKIFREIYSLMHILNPDYWLIGDLKKETICTIRLLCEHGKIYLVDVTDAEEVEIINESW